MARIPEDGGTGREWISGNDLNKFFNKIRSYRKNKMREQSQNPPVPTRPVSHEVFVDPSNQGKKGN